MLEVIHQGKRSKFVTFQVFKCITKLETRVLFIISPWKDDSGFLYQQS